MAPRNPEENLHEDPDELENDEGQEGESEGQDDGEAEGEGELSANEGEDTEEGSVEPSRRPSRAETRVRAALAQARTAQAAADEARREVAELRAQRQQPQGETPEMRAARRELMTPAERSEDRLNELVENQNRQNAAMQFQIMDTADKAAYDVKAAASPRHVKYKAEVEAALATLRGKGQNVDRETLLAYIIGQKVLKGGTEKVKQVQRGADNVRRAKTQPTNGQGDVRAERRQTSSLEKRLENISI